MSATLRRVSLAIAGLAVLAAACAAPGGGGATVTASPSAASPSAASSGTANGAQVTVAHTSAGDALAGPNGMTLYVFTRDTGTTPTCTGTCAANWPPFTVTSGSTATAGSGVDASMLGTTSGENGKTQVTYNGHPLYYFAGDSAAGDAKGQGLNGIWFIAAPDGSMGGASAAPSGEATPTATDLQY